MRKKEAKKRCAPKTMPKGANQQKRRGTKVAVVWSVAGLEQRSLPLPLLLMMMMRRVRCQSSSRSGAAAAQTWKTWTCSNGAAPSKICASFEQLRFAFSRRLLFSCLPAFGLFHSFACASASASTSFLSFLLWPSLLLLFYGKFSKPTRKFATQSARGSGNTKPYDLIRILCSCYRCCFLIPCSRTVGRVAYLLHCLNYVYTLYFI